MTVEQQALVAANHVNFLFARAAREICHTDSKGRRICTKESFFHRVGRWIMTGCLVFFGLIALLILCCCIKRHRSKAKKAAANNGYPTQA
jgi:hypothetical protein